MYKVKDHYAEVSPLEARIAEKERFIPSIYDFKSSLLIDISTVRFIKAFSEDEESFTRALRFNFREPESFEDLDLSQLTLPPLI